MSSMATASSWSVPRRCARKLVWGTPKGPFPGTVRRSLCAPDHSAYVKRGKISAFPRILFIHTFLLPLIGRTQTKPERLLPSLGERQDQAISPGWSNQRDPEWQSFRSKAIGSCHGAAIKQVYEVGVVPKITV